MKAFTIILWSVIITAVVLICSTNKKQVSHAMKVGAIYIDGSNTSGTVVYNTTIYQAPFWFSMTPEKSITNGGVALLQKNNGSNSWYELDFAPTNANQSASWLIPGVATKSWDGTPITNRITWYCDSTNSGNVIYQLLFKTVTTNGNMTGTFNSPAHIITNATSSVQSNLTTVVLVFSPTTNEMIAGQSTKVLLQRLGDSLVGTARVVEASTFR